jgi:hypothetical protein
MRRAILVAAVLFALLAKPAVALTGNELRQWCNQQGDPIAEGFCLGYVVGVRDILPEDCVPQTATLWADRTMFLLLLHDRRRYQVQNQGHRTSGIDVHRPYLCQRHHRHCSLDMFSCVCLEREQS